MSKTSTKDVVPVRKSLPISRCRWCAGDAVYEAYHDNEWGVPITDPITLFGFLILEGAQAGLSWITVLKRREEYHRAFHNFDVKKMSAMAEDDVERILVECNVIRHRGKVKSAINNARAYLALEEAGECFSQFLWQFAPSDGATFQRTYADIPASTVESLAMSKALKKRGFNFVGETICYAFMQAVGMVNDHDLNCYRHLPIARLQKSARKTMGNINKA